MMEAFGSTHHEESVARAHVEVLNRIDLKRYGEHMALKSTSFAPAPGGMLRHSCNEQLSRHTHKDPFAAIVVRGSYLEAGDRGRIRVVPGDVILHGPFESHSDEFSESGAEVLILPFESKDLSSPLARVRDPDGIARISKHDMREAISVLEEQLQAVQSQFFDWPDQLAHDLQHRPSFPLSVWAEKKNLRQETLSRGFRRVFGVTPQAFRARSRLLRAVGRVRQGEQLSQVARCCGFADQSHLTREFRALIGVPPGCWQRGEMIDPNEK